MDLMGMIQGTVTDSLVSELSKKIGVDSNTGGKIINSILPSIMGGLSKNADSDSESINKALDSHDDGVMGNISELVNSPENFKGDKILGHIFGSEESNIEETIGSKLGVEKNTITQAMMSLAPLVMGKLGSAKKSGIDVASLLHEDKSIKGMFTSFIDKDNDGSITDDLLSMGGGFLKNKFM